jgi:hypothetical protein
MALVVALAATAAAVCARYQEREKGRGKERGKTKINKRGPLVIKPRTFFLCFLNTSKQTPGTWPYLG